MSSNDSAKSPVYVLRNPSASSILPGSAIIGGQPMETGRRLVYYEGNRYQSSNLNRFVERCLHAHGRMVQRYPTTAMAVLRLEERVPVGEYDSVRQMVIVSDMARLQAWLELKTLPVSELVYQNPLLVRNIEHFQQLATGEDPAEFWMFLNGGLRSTKACIWTGERFWILNEIDGSEETLTANEVAASLIGEAIRQRAFYHCISGVDRVGY